MYDEPEKTVDGDEEEKADGDGDEEPAGATA